MKYKVKILIVDDNPKNLFALETTFKDIEAEFIKATSGNDALKEILRHGEELALAILDVRMPDMDGYELAQLIRGWEQTRKLPIILLSAVYSDNYHVFKGYNSGAVDFITKPFQPAILAGKINFFIELYFQQRKLKETIVELETTKQLVLKQNDILEKQASHDELTGLYNRRKLKIVMQEEVEKCRKTNSDLSIIMLDLDCFRNVNDEFGYEFGEYVIQEFSVVLQSCIKSSDFAFRYGCKKFIVLLPRTDLDAAVMIAEKIRRLCVAKEFSDDVNSTRITVSSGVASYVKHRPKKDEDMINSADQALRYAKETGKNKVVVSSSATAALAKRLKVCM
ncbi:diguanylate cyclase [Candidatus Electronema sp. PJ]|uniref:GGDEF domain-containing response regulator n=1 Tax=Candidatus Electronema sp. PJ TaxID=3401572 RepID=UPI003AA91AE1